MTSWIPFEDLGKKTIDGVDFYVSRGPSGKEYKTSADSVEKHGARYRLKCDFDQMGEGERNETLRQIGHLPIVSDNINHPPHYKSHSSGVECIQITEHMNFCLGNAVKYIWRAGLKSESPVEDLQKARWYIDREIQRLESFK